MASIELTPNFEEALVFSFRLHARQKRKVTNVPYISHLLSVAALVLEDGGDEEQAIAALLHDAVEDQGGIPVLDAIRTRFGYRVADIVDGCTDSYVIPKRPWRERKTNYIERLHSAHEDVRRVSLADKVHNARMIVSSLQQYGDTIWESFNGGKKGTLWYYEELLKVYRKTGNGLLIDELERLVIQMQKLAGL
jgi:(p)ppGpp synthase/HD superfamily hydrolase